MKASIALAVLLLAIVARGQGFTDADLAWKGNITHVPPTNLTAGLIGWWKCDETNGTTLNDSSGSGFNGSLLAGGSINWVGGKIGGAVQLGGTGNWGFDVGAHHSLQTPPFTYTAWVWCTNTANYWCIIGPSAINDPVFALYQPTSQIYLGNYAGALGISTGSITSGQWWWVAMSYDQTGTAAIKFYTNSVSAGNANSSGTFPLSANFWIGTQVVNTYTWNGMLDDIRVYNRILSTNEISYLYHQWYAQP